MAPPKDLDIFDLAPPADEHPKLIAMFDYWRRLRGSRAMPRPDEFDILDIWPLAGNIHLIDVCYEDGRRRFFIRLWATNIGQMLRQDYHHRYVDEFEPIAWRDALTEALGRVVDNRRPEFSETGRIVDRRPYPGFRRLVCPLSSDGIAIDRLVCAAVPLDLDV